MLSGDESGEKMTYGLALRICDVRGMRLPSLAELYSAMINKSNDECALKQDEYWSEAAGWKFDDGSARGFIVTTYSPSSGLSAVSPEEYRRVRCVEK